MSFELVFAAATDDLMIFSDARPGVTQSAANRVDSEFQRRGAVRNSRKDIDDEVSATCVGVQLEEGTHLGVPHRDALQWCFFALCAGKSLCVPQASASNLGSATVV